MNQDFTVGVPETPCSCEGKVAGDADGCGGVCVACTEAEAPACVDRATKTTIKSSGSYLSCSQIVLHDLCNHANADIAAIAQTQCPVSCGTCPSLAGTCPVVSDVSPSPPPPLPSRPLSPLAPPSVQPPSEALARNSPLAPPPVQRSSEALSLNGSVDGGAIAGVVIGVISLVTLVSLSYVYRSWLGCCRGSQATLEWVAVAQNRRRRSNDGGAVQSQAARTTATVSSNSAAKAQRPHTHNDLADLTVVNTSSVELIENEVEDAGQEDVASHSTLFAHAQLSNQLNKLGVTRKDMRASL